MTGRRPSVLLEQSGDTAAFEKLLRRLHAPLRKYVTDLAGESTADDILQDVSKIVALINKNTLSILRAVADINRK